MAWALEMKSPKEASSIFVFNQFTMIGFRSFLSQKKEKMQLSKCDFFVLKYSYFFLQARRANITTVILPEGNRKDYDDLQDFIKKSIDVHFVNTYRDIFDIALNSE